MNTILRYLLLKRVHKTAEKRKKPSIKDSPVKQLIDRIGGVTAFLRALEKAGRYRSRGAVYKWLKDGQIPRQAWQDVYNTCMIHSGFSSEQYGAPNEPFQPKRPPKKEKQKGGPGGRKPGKWSEEYLRKRKIALMTKVFED
jgi:hypothetical protein